MNYKQLFLSFVATLFWLTGALAQQVPYGINYQAVARNSLGEELANKTISIRFSIHSGSKSGNLEYQEVHSDVETSDYGVFEVTIGSGSPVAGSCELFKDIRWELDDYYLKVEIKFAAVYLEMGTMSFLSVPYALYAGRSLEPGPEGPPGPAGDPASDDQTLSFNGVNLAISGGNEVNLAAFLAVNDADPDPENEIQSLSFNSVDSKLQIIGGNEVDLSTLVNTDNQELAYNPITHVLTIQNGTNSIDLDDLKDDADASTTNELISSITIEGSELVIDEGSTEHRIDLSSNLIAFRAEKILTSTGLSMLTNYDFIANNIQFNDGSAYNNSTGIFTAPLDGIYTFNIGYYANGNGDIRKLFLYLNESLFETLQTNISGGSSLLKSVTLKLNQNDEVKIVFNTGAALESGTGSFSGFRVY